MKAPQERPHETIKRIAAELGPEFSGVASPETVERFVADSYAAFAEGASVTDYIALFVERSARDRLRAATQAERLMDRSVPEVLFVCVHNAGRSQMAAALLTHLAAGDVRARSAGTAPADTIDLAVVEALDEWGIDVTRESPRPLTDELVRAADVVVSMGCGDVWPLYPGKRYLEWPLDDPSGRSVEDVRRIRDEIRSHVEGLLDELLAPAF